MLDTEIAIVGAGPAGLMLAIELGCRDIPCVLIDRHLEAPAFPKANATSARTMEHYRRRGFAQRVRAVGMPPDYPQDIVYRTTLSGADLTHFRIPSRRDAERQAAFGDYGADNWPTPELPHRAQQMLIEPVLREEVARYPSVARRYGDEALEALDAGDHALVTLATPGTQTTVRARYVVGCDGPRSIVRRAIGAGYGGTSAVKRDFFGGPMLTLYVRSSAMYSALGGTRAWQYWAVNRHRRGLMLAVNGVDTFAFLIQLRENEELDHAGQRAFVEAVVGRPFEFEIIGASPWTAGHALVADRFRAGRLAIAGDAAHLFTPTGGMGYNTSIDDAVNLGWKLALLVRGTAGDALLDSYEAERRPIAARNTAFSKRMADSIGGITIPDGIEADDAAGAAARAKLGQALAEHVRNEFNIPGLQLGLNYAGSPIVAAEASPLPPDLPNHYVPTARPGARAPHVLVGDRPLFDSFGRDFTLLCFDSGDASPWTDAARALGLGLTVLPVRDAAAHALYAAERVLIRPDHHVAWRGTADAPPAPLLAHAIARAGT
ncbi:MAG: FAD-dependent monooxygenase [Burkholderiales bacterium]|nr:FAD-dependent monooxygenase [Burkholderiales bacterium]